MFRLCFHPFRIILTGKFLERVHREVENKKEEKCTSRTHKQMLSPVKLTCPNGKVRQKVNQKGALSTGHRAFVD